MLPGIGGGELIVIAIVALIVVGPRDLPKLLRQVGRFVGKMRNMADEFRSSFDDMAHQSELDDLRKEVESIRSGTNIKPLIEDFDTQMSSLNDEIMAPTRHGYSKARHIVSPDASGGHETPEIEKPRPKRLKRTPVPKMDIEAEATPAKKSRKAKKQAGET